MTHVRGIVLQRLGRNEEALDLLSIPRDRPQRAGSLFYLGEARRGLGRFDEAVETYENVLGLPGDSEWHRRAREALASLQRSAPFR
ncbi:MAG: tetratricopeptide repeat protein [Deltaproteobacteria bacterium]|nr:tetratricopeptide repeat protein [Deltaproteobacteria bacterium]